MDITATDDPMESGSMDITAIDDPKELEMLLGRWHPIEGSSGYDGRGSPLREKRVQIVTGKTTTPAPAAAIPGCAARGRFAACPAVRHRTPKENARLRYGDSGRQRRVAEGCTLGRSRDVSRHRRVVYRITVFAAVDHDSFAARGAEETMLLHRHVQRSVVDGRASRISVGCRIKHHRLSGLVPAAETGATCPPPAADSAAMEGVKESESPPQQHPLANVLASSLDSCTLASDTADPGDGDLAVDLAFMSV
uniref:Uncharacterized protein n=1 Tax=Oryza meridionalis TaxID=40149 RepID=A0A0E0CQV1_9ORYZ